MGIRDWIKKQVEHQKQSYLNGQMRGHEILADINCRKAMRKQARKGRRGR